MATKKNHYYVLVFTEKGPVYVTSVDYSTKYASWNRLEKPLEFSKYTAEDLCFGLNCNFNQSVVACVPYELDYQPYRYADFEFEVKEIVKEII